MKKKKYHTVGTYTKYHTRNIYKIPHCRNIYKIPHCRNIYKIPHCRNIYKIQLKKGARVAQWVGSLDLTTHTSLLPIRREFAPSFVNYKKMCTRIAAASDKAYQLLAQGRWFSPASSTTKTGRHDIAEILLKVALNTNIQIPIEKSLKEAKSTA